MMRHGPSHRRLRLLALIPATFFANQLSRDGVAQSQEDAASGLRLQQQYCANVATSAESARIARQQKILAEMEAQLSANLSALEAKQKELRAELDRLDSFERKSSEALVSLYSAMKPDVAAAQLSELDEDVAAALLLRLKAKSSSAILNEMEAARGAALAKRLALLRPANDGKKQP